MKYLGTIISAEGVKPNLAKIYTYHFQHSIFQLTNLQ